MVTFSHIPYSDALKEGQRQDAVMEEVLSWPGIAENWDTTEVFGRIMALASR
jgi:kynurenine 3-monooxygenase